MGLLDKYGFNRSSIMANEQMTLRGTLTGHKGWVTKIATTPAIPEMILSASRDKSLIVWKLTRDESTYGVMNRRLTGHSHFVSDVVISSDGQFALSGSWDGDLRLWNRNKVSLLGDLLVIQKMFCQLPSLEIIVKLYQHLVTKPLNCGILLDNANTPLLRMVTMIGFHAFNSHQTPTHQSSCHADGTRSSRYGT